MQQSDSPPLVLMAVDQRLPFVKELCLAVGLEPSQEVREPLAKMLLDVTEQIAALVVAGLDEFRGSLPSSCTATTASARSSVAAASAHLS